MHLASEDGDWRTCAECLCEYAGISPEEIDIKSIPIKQESWIVSLYHQPGPEVHLYHKDNIYVWRSSRGFEMQIGSPWFRKDPLPIAETCIKVIGFKELSFHPNKIFISHEIE